MCRLALTGMKYDDPPGWQMVDMVRFHCAGHAGGGHAVPFKAHVGLPAAATAAAEAMAAARSIVTLAAAEAAAARGLTRRVGT